MWIARNDNGLRWMRSRETDWLRLAKLGSIWPAGAGLEGRSVGKNAVVILGEAVNHASGFAGGAMMVVPPPTPGVGVGRGLR